VWGLRRQWHSHRFIHQGFFQTVRYLGIPVVWTDFTSDPATIESGDFVITSHASGRGTRGSTLAPFKSGTYYCFHGFNHSGYQGNDRAPRHEIERKYAVNLEVFVNTALNPAIRGMRLRTSTGRRRLCISPGERI